MIFIIIAGVVIGALAILLTAQGNPANMGFCIACFLRDIAGGLGLHRAGAVMYLRPEIAGLGLGATLIALAKGEFRARGGANPLLRFGLGFLMMIGALVFLGCPLRMVLRLAGGDLNALVGLLGFIAGIYAGVLALKSGYNSGRSVPQARGTGFIYPAVLASLLVAVALRPEFIFFSSEGPGSMAAPIVLSLGAGLVVGILAQRSRLCMAGGIRDLILIGDPHLLWGFIGIFGAALIGNIALGNFSLGFANQPIAHTAHLWNFLGLAVVGFAAVLAGGCPLRQLIMAGEGDTDAVITVLGMVAGAAFSHNFGLAGSGAGVAPAGRIAVIIALALLTLAGFGHRLSKKARITDKEAA
ncbi:MAG: YedE family putative selenium transporter [Bacillota bacterium]|jgi:YedE family putative selenium metabolism protein